jgi:short subunit dehydrogenase-like uncharacterized protein
VTVPQRRAEHERPYDVVLYGASGFTGRQTVAYFARHAPEGVRWAIAGRNRQRLEAVRSELAPEVDLLVADSHDGPALDAIAARTRVLLTTAGPFAVHGDLLVDACVRSETHYVDITGETLWVRSLIDRHHDRAAASGTRIVPFCGFDSVPSDLGAYLVARHVRRLWGVPCERVHAIFRMAGGVNGGTLATVFHLYESGNASRIADPYLLNPQNRRPAEPNERDRDPRAPRIHPDARTWVGPFFMGPINTRVVRRSAALQEAWDDSYGPDFSYQEYLGFDEPLAALQAIGMLVGGVAAQGVMRQPLLRRLVRPLLPAPGTGPSERTMNEGWFSCDLFGTAADGRQVRGTIRGAGDPGNRATVAFVCESALCLALHADELPGGPARGGVLTPATALGDVLAERLRGAGMRVEVEPPKGGTVA